MEQSLPLSKGPPRRFSLTAQVPPRAAASALLRRHLAHAVPRGGGAPGASTPHPNTPLSALCAFSGASTPPCRCLCPLPPSPRLRRRFSTPPSSSRGRGSLTWPRRSRPGSRRPTAAPWRRPPGCSSRCFCPSRPTCSRPLPAAYPRAFTPRPCDALPGAHARADGGDGLGLHAAVQCARARLRPLRAGAQLHIVPSTHPPPVPTSLHSDTHHLHLFTPHPYGRLPRAGGVIGDHPVRDAARAARRSLRAIRALAGGDPGARAGDHGRGAARARGDLREAPCDARGHGAAGAAGVVRPAAARAQPGDDTPPHAPRTRARMHACMPLHASQCNARRVPLRRRIDAQCQCATRPTRASWRRTSPSSRAAWWSGAATCRSSARRTARRRRRRRRTSWSACPPSSEERTRTRGRAATRRPTDEAVATTPAKETETAGCRSGSCSRCCRRGSSSTSAYAFSTPAPAF